MPACGYKRNCNYTSTSKLDFMLDVHKLRVLHEVAAQGSFSAAATQLHFSPSAVSQHIAALEDQAGAKLVVRSSRGVRLTDAGQLLVRHADAILRRLQDAEAELGAMLALRGGRLRLAAFASVGATLLAQAIAAFHRAHPDIEVSLIDADAGPALDALRRGDIDLALVFNYNVAQLIDPTDADLTEILVEPIYAVLPTSHRLAGTTEPIRLNQLADEPWIQCYTASCGLLLDRAARSAGFTPSVAFQTDDYPATLALIATGLGVALLPAISLLDVGNDIRIRRISSPSLTRHIAGATAPGLDHPPAVTAMLATLHQTASRYNVDDLAATTPRRR